MIDVDQFSIEVFQSLAFLAKVTISALGEYHMV
jgi:hypothetical protein